MAEKVSSKTICAKLLVYFKSFVCEIVEVASNDQNKRSLDSGFKNKFKDYFPHDCWGVGYFLII